MDDKRGLRNEDARPERSRKPEKMASEPQTEYLDMDTDEEEFGRQETPESEDKEPLEPEKPVFTDEELNTLVKYVQDLTILPSLSEYHWNEECCFVIREYFREPKNTILTIFFFKRELKASLDFPLETSDGLTYFLRSPWQVYTTENFQSTVIFGNINENTENTLLKFMECIYAPVAFNSDEWPFITKNEVFSTLHDFIICLTDQVYKPMGLTILYIPREGLEIKKTNLDEFLLIPNEFEKEEVKKEEDDEKELNDRLEKIARTWIKQIREALIALPLIQKELNDMTDEFDYWHHKYDNLSCLLHQMSNENVTWIIGKLENLRSTSIKQFKPLLEEIKLIIEEASINITYLNILLEACNEIQKPADIEIHVSKIILLLIFIQSISSFYSITENIEVLYQALSIRIINFLKDYVDLEKIFQGKALETKTMVETCIFCCNRYSEIYDQIVFECIDEVDNWNLDKENVFKSVDSFLNRCNDVIEICNATVVFSKVGSPIMFGGSKGKIYDMYHEELQNSFAIILEKIREPCIFALDITNISWFQFMTKFKHEVSELENMLKNMINDMFEEVQNIDEGIETLYSLQKFRQRPDLEILLNDKWMEVWKIFSREIKICYSTIDYKKSLNEFNGNISITHLNRQYSKMINTSDWFGDCDIQWDVIKMYKDVISVISTLEHKDDIQD